MTDLAAQLIEERITNPSVRACEWYGEDLVEDWEREDAESVRFEEDE